MTRRTHGLLRSCKHGKNSTCKACSSRKAHCFTRKPSPCTAIRVVQIIICVLLNSHAFASGDSHPAICVLLNSHEAAVTTTMSIVSIVPTFYLDDPDHNQRNKSRLDILVSFNPVAVLHSTVGGYESTNHNFPETVHTLLVQSFNDFVLTQ